VPAKINLLTSLKSVFSTKRSGRDGKKKKSPSLNHANTNLLANQLTKLPDYQITSLLKNYLQALKDDQCSSATIRNYRSDIKQFIDFIGGENIEKILTKPKLNAFETYQREKGLKEASIRRKVTSITQFALWSKKQGYLSSWVTKLSSNRVDGLSSERVTGHLGKWVDESSSKGVRRVNAHSNTQITSQITKLPNYQITSLPDYQITKAPNYQSTKSPNHQITNLLKNYLLALQLTGCSVATIKNYRSDINQFLEFGGENQLEKAVTKPKLELFASSQVKKGLKIASVLRKLTSVTQFGLWARKQGMSVEAEIEWPHYIIERIEKGLAASRLDTSQLKDSKLQTTGFRILKRLGFGRNLKKTAQKTSYLDEVSKRHPTKAWAYLNLVATVLFMLGLGYFGYQQFNEEHLDGSGEQHNYQKRAEDGLLMVLEVVFVWVYASEHPPPEAEPKLRLHSNDASDSSGEKDF